MALIQREGDRWVVTGRKHEGRTLEEVATADPDYLAWIYKKANEGLSDEAFYALEDKLVEIGMDPT